MTFRAANISKSCKIRNGMKTGLGPGRFEDRYAFDKEGALGAGAFGTVTRATRRVKTGTEYAINTISKTSLKHPELLRNEVCIMKRMDHPNIVKLYETFDDSEAVYLVMELCKGANLLDNILGARCFSEVQAAICMKQVIRAVKYMHDNFVCHRDLKPDNLIFLKKAPISENVLKVIDFGMSTTFKTGEAMHEKVGCPYCVAPQVLERNYDNACDLWSCGVIMYMILAGCPPFVGESAAEAIRKVRKGQWSFDQRHWKKISEDAKDLVRMLLKMNPGERFTADKALNHVWIKEHAPRAEVASLGSEFFDNLRKFKSMNKMQKTALHIIARKLTDDRIKVLRDTFMAFDTNQDGMLTISEIKDGLADNGIIDIPQDLQQLLMDMDSDGSGVIDYTEFLAATMKKEHMTQETYWQAFATFDRDCDGVISNTEVKEVLNSGSLAGVATESGIERILLEADSNGDGAIDFEEFRKMMATLE